MGMLFLWGIDLPNLGKVDKHAFSQQTLMEMFLDGVINKEKVCGSKISPKPLCRWENVILSSSQQVIDIVFLDFGLEGSIRLEWMPLTVCNAWLNYNSFIGTANLRNLPDSIELLSLSGNKLYGEIDLSNLPTNLKQLFLSKNNFEGEVNFCCLPESLEWLDVSNTDLSGEIIVTGTGKKFNVVNSNVHIRLI